MNKCPTVRLSSFPLLRKSRRTEIRTENTSMASAFVVTFQCASHTERSQIAKHHSTPYQFIMRTETQLLACLLAVIAIAFNVVHGCNLKSLFMGNKLSAASAGALPTTKSIFDFKVDAITGQVDLETYRLLFLL